MSKIVFHMLISLDGLFVGFRDNTDQNSLEDEYNSFSVDFINTQDSYAKDDANILFMLNPLSKIPVTSKNPYISERIANANELVYTNTLRKIGLNKISLSKEVAVEKIHELNEEYDPETVLFGNSDLSKQFIENNLIDAISDMLNPLISDNKESIIDPAFDDTIENYDQKLLPSKTFISGNILMFYETIN